MTTLARVNLLLLVALIAHTVDHAVNQPARELPASGSVVGILGFVVVAASAIAALRRMEIAPAASVFAGVSTGFGIVAVHLLPSWSEFVSDPYANFEANAITWVAALTPLVIGLWLAVLGMRELHRPAAA